MKTKWFNANINIDYKGLHKGFVESPFDEQKGWGFQVEKYSPKMLQVKYSEKILISDKVVDPFGHETAIEYVKYLNFNFWIIHEHKENHILMIENPPRTIKHFINNVMKCLSTDFNVSTCKLDINSLALFFEGKSCNIEFKKVKIKGLTFGQNTFGDIEIESSVDALKDFENTFSNKKFHIDKAKLLIKCGGVDNMVDVSSTGAIIFDDEFFDEIILAVENSR